MQRQHIKVLLIEDNPGDVRLIWEILSEIRNSPFYLNVADTLKKGLEEITREEPDVILLDLSLPDSNGIYTLNRVKDRAAEIPVVVITGLDDEITAIKSLKEGAQDYLVKGRTDSDLLKKALIYAIERNRMISELELSEKKLREADTVKTGFISKVVHELLIPLNTIRKSANAAINNPKKDNLRDIEAIKNNAEKLYGLMDDLIDVSKMERGSFLIEKKLCIPAESIDRIIKEIRPLVEEKNVIIENKTKISTEAMLDCKRISQALSNLIINSINSSKKGALITIGLSESEKNDEKLSEKFETAGIAGTGLLYYVRDHGSGIPKKQLDEVFNSYFSEKGFTAQKYKDIGLGLEITKNIIMNHGGIMWAESEGKGKGCTFYMLIPKE